MSKEPASDDRRERMAQMVREIVTGRERAPRSPRLERALKRLIWRYSRQLQRYGPRKTNSDGSPPPPQ